MRVDHTGHQGAAVAIDYLRVGDRFAWGDEGFDEPTFDQHILSLDELGVCAVENAHVLEPNRFRGGLRENRTGEAKRGRREARSDPLQNGSARQVAVDACEQSLRLWAMAGAGPVHAEVLILRTKSKRHAGFLSFVSFTNLTKELSPY
ncbi:hypothetical protein ACWX0K_23575 [Nitrobacteraceae bacterium UC4446_H13]